MCVSAWIVRSNDSAPGYLHVKSVYFVHGLYLFHFRRAALAEQRIRRLAQGRIGLHWEGVSETLSDRYFASAWGRLERNHSLGPVLAGLGTTILTGLAAQGKPTRAAVTPEKVFVTRYCLRCHSDNNPAGGLSLKKIDLSHPELSAAVSEKVLLKLRAGMMPPADQLRPTDAEANAFTNRVARRIDAAAALHPNAGSPLVHRLNRTEYANCVRDLLDLNVNVVPLLPPDDSSRGFDNMSEVLNVSPALLTGYVRAAGKISRLAVADPTATPTEVIYHVPSTLSQTQRIDGAPLGTRGGIVFQHNFPADGEYTFRCTLYFTTNTFLFGTHQKDEKLEVAVNGERVALFDVNPAMKVDDALKTPPVKIKAGPQTISVAFIQKASGAVEDFVQPFEHSLGDLFLGRTQGLTGLPHLRDVAVNGPYHVTGVSDTPSRKRIFLVRPASESGELTAAKRILSVLARRAYRRPVTQDDLESLLTVYHEGRLGGNFETGIRAALQYLLASPSFVFRFERAPAALRPGALYRLSDVELASRLSFFLWSSAPDERLLDLAERGRLHQPAILEAEVRRMLADRRSSALATNFAGQWLHLRNLSDIQPDLFAFPNANRNLLDSMRRETELFFDSIVREDRDIHELLTADYTFVDENLARHYGIPDIEGPRFRRVRIADDTRRGLLGQASILTVTSFANRTSPVTRGKWVLDNLLGAPPPKAPANVPPLQEATEGAVLPTVRERLEEHRKNPACASCHTIMDPVGFALERFDATGALRSRDLGRPIDTHGRLVDGTPVNGPAQLRAAIVRRSDAYRENVAGRLLSYALGRTLDHRDMPTVRSIDAYAAAHGRRFSGYVLGIVNSVPFQMRQDTAGVPLTLRASETAPDRRRIAGGSYVSH